MRCQAAAVFREAPERLVEVGRKQVAFGPVSVRVEGADARALFGEELFEAREEERVHVREVAGVLVRRPAPGRGPALERRGGHFAHERDDERRRVL